MGKRIDITGRRFGHLVAVRPVKTDQNGDLRWEFICDCGRTIITRGRMARIGAASSCGCRSREKAWETRRRNQESHTSGRDRRAGENVTAVNVGGVNPADHIGLYYMIAKRAKDRGLYDRWDHNDIVSVCYIAATGILRNYDPKKGAVSTYLVRSLWLFLKREYMRRELGDKTYGRNGATPSPKTIFLDDGIGDMRTAEPVDVIGKLSVEEFLDELSPEDRADLWVTMWNGSNRGMGRSLGRSHFYWGLRLDEWIKPFAAEWFGVDYEPYKLHTPASLRQRAPAHPKMKPLVVKPPYQPQKRSKRSRIHEGKCGRTFSLSEPKPPVSLSTG